MFTVIQSNGWVFWGFGWPLLPNDVYTGFNVVTSLLPQSCDYWVGFCQCLMKKRLGTGLLWARCALWWAGWQKYSSPLSIQTWSPCDKGLCPAWKVQSAAISDDQALRKVFKRVFQPCFLAPWVKRVGCATGSPIFQSVGYPEKRPLYNSDCDGRGCGRLVPLFPLASQSLSLCDGRSWERGASSLLCMSTVEGTPGRLLTFPMCTYSIMHPSKH